MAITNIQTASASGSLSCSLTITDGVGNNRKVICAVMQERNPLTITAPTLNSVTGTLVATITDTTFGTLKTMVYEWNDAGTNGIAAMPSAAGSYTLASSGLGIDVQIAGLSCSGAKQTAAADPRTEEANSAADPSFTLSADSGSIAFIALFDGSASQTLTKGSGQTDIIAPTATTNSKGGVSYDDADLTVSYTRSGSAVYAVVAAAIEPAPATAPSLSITSVTPSSFDDGHAGIVIAGTGFGASQGSSTLKIGTQAQTVTAWSDTSITFTCVRGSNSVGATNLTLTKV